MNKKIKENMEKFNIPERSLAGLGIIICIAILITIVSYNKLRTEAFRLDNNIANENYNILADEIANKGYKINMVSNEDNTFSIIGNYENNNVSCDIHVTVNNNGKVVSNVIETSAIYEINTKIIKFNYDKLKNQSMLNYYSIFNDALNFFGDSISRKDFQLLVKNSFSYLSVTHGQYQSEKYIYEIYFKDNRIHINVRLK